MLRRAKKCYIPLQRGFQKSPGAVSVFAQRHCKTILDSSEIYSATFDFGVFPRLQKRVMVISPSHSVSQRTNRKINYSVEWLGLIKVI